VAKHKLNKKGRNEGMFCSETVFWQDKGRGGALVETMTFNRRVVGSTLDLAAT